jgi:hypothetical protein
VFVSAASSRCGCATSMCNAQDFALRSKKMCEVASMLKTINAVHGVSVVVVNQVTDVVDGELVRVSAHGSTQVSCGRKVKPALGYGWECCINARYILTRDSVMATASSRKIHCIFSPVTPATSTAFRIDRSGVWSIETEQFEHDHNEYNSVIPASTNKALLAIPSTTAHPGNGHRSPQAPCGDGDVVTPVFGR